MLRGTGSECHVFGALDFTTYLTLGNVFVFEINGLSQLAPRLPQGWLVINCAIHTRWLEQDSNFAALQSFFLVRGKG